MLAMNKKIIIIIIFIFEHMSQSLKKKIQISYPSHVHTG